MIFSKTVRSFKKFLDNEYIVHHKPSNDENFYVAFVNVQVTSIDEKQVFLIDPVFTLLSQFSRI